MRVLGVFGVFVLFMMSSLSIAWASAPHYKKVMVIVLENTNFKTALQQPFFAQMAKRGALFTDFIAETHPSQPNYIALVAGGTFGVKSDKDVTLSVSHLGDLLEQKGKTWKVYAEDYPGDCFLGASKSLYVRKHVPFLSFSNVQSDPVRCAKIASIESLETDFKAGSLPDFAMVIPNLQNDGHNTNAPFADRWLAGAFGPRFEDPRFMKDLLVVLTFDEAENLFLKNQVFTVMLGDSVIPGSVVSTPTNHYGILRTIEDTLGLATLGREDATASAITGIWKEPLNDSGNE